MSTPPGDGARAQKKKKKKRKRASGGASGAATTGPLVTELRSIEEQVGVHVVEALQRRNTVAVLTTVIGTDAGQQIISIGLDARKLGQVQELLAAARKPRAPKVRCIGFHCRLREDGTKT